MHPTPITMTAATSRDQFYTVKEAASILKMSDDTIRRMMNRGAIKFIRVGKRMRRISQKALDELAERGY